MSFTKISHSQTTVIIEDTNDGVSSPIEQSFLDQRRAEAKALIVDRHHELRGLRAQITNHVENCTTAEEVADVIANLERKGDFVSAELFREHLLGGKILTYTEVVLNEKPKLSCEEIKKRREEARRKMNSIDDELLDFMKEQTVRAIGRGNAQEFIAGLEAEGDFYKAEIARTACIEAGLLKEEYEAEHEEYVQLVRDFILSCNEDPRRVVARLHHEGRYQDAHVMADLLKTPEIQQKLADISIGRDLIKELRADCAYLDALEQGNVYEEVVRQIEASKVIIKEQLSVLKKYLNEHKFTLTQIGSHQAEIDAIEHSI